MTALPETRMAAEAEPELRLPVLEIQNVSKRFTTKRADTLALDNINLSVRDGEFVCLLGPSGCGKSTLLNMIAGFDAPDGGKVIANNKVVKGPGPDRVVVFQEAALFPWMNVRANVEFGLKLAGMGSAERKERARNYLRLVGLERFEKSYVHELSGGMKQRVQLARSLAVEPRMLLMDEPFAALDAQTRDVLQEELQTIWQRTGKTIIFVTHNVREAVLLADRIIVMSPSPGRIKREIEVTLEHPRSPDSHAIVDLAADIREELRNPDHIADVPGKRWSI
ncbi:nitrate/sulfonate/bicarbonate ABC transporter ATP-binding protein [bacterium SCGC AG-212-C10]|nr:nitrate/sulfonate/bicarbonate ABC transporter ATP-binding protein [bacterium SCGC AG-212-C10]